MDDSTESSGKQKFIFWTSQIVFHLILGGLYYTPKNIFLREAFH